jgi:DNA-binding PadR family transcriptional regulator
MPTAASPASPRPAPVPTQTGYTLLGLLSFGRELSGYELKQWADNLRFFWSAPAMSQVYRELERLAAAGLVIQRSVVREGTRATKVYRLSAVGEQAVRAWLATPPGPPVLRHPVALRVFFGHLLEPGALRAAIEPTGRGATTCWPSSGTCAASWATTRCGATRHWWPSGASTTTGASGLRSTASSTP